MFFPRVCPWCLKRPSSDHLTSMPSTSGMKDSIEDCRLRSCPYVPSFHCVHVFKHQPRERPYECLSISCTAQLPDIFTLTLFFAQEHGPGLANSSKDSICFTVACGCSCLGRALVERAFSMIVSDTRPCSIFSASFFPFDSMLPLFLDFLVPSFFLSPSLLEIACLPSSGAICFL